MGRGRRSSPESHTHIHTFTHKYPASSPSPERSERGTVQVSSSGCVGRPFCKAACTEQDGSGQDPEGCGFMVDIAACSEVQQSLHCRHDIYIQVPKCLLVPAFLHHASSKAAVARALASPRTSRT